ncbi:hypothetical protein LXA43DRAFT_1103693 [Ganoderma leucocontextum]|nr:hypothetical protein LXA43DRAFT_1103693 [Ganoderma leucocontextum]
MPSPRRFESFILSIAILFLGLNFTYKFVNLMLLYRQSKHQLKPNGGVWDVERKPVAFAFDSGLRYDLNASQAWGALVPGEGLVRLGVHREPFMVAMFHQLRCLDVMRDQLTKPRAQRDEQPARHCMNYIRQMILCRGDTHLDPYQYPSNIHPVEPHPVRRCLDWRAVYEAVEANQKEYAEWARPGASATRRI